MRPNIPGDCPGDLVCLNPRMCHGLAVCPLRLEAHLTAVNRRTEERAAFPVCSRSGMVLGDGARAHGTCPDGERCRRACGGGAA